jgi:16S rRNA C1402 N4-methylase RsmH
MMQAQEVLKSVSHSGEPMYNIIEFCGEENLARAIPSHPVDQRATNPSLSINTVGAIVENLL